MKRTLSFMVMALALLLTQCRKPEVKFPSPVAPEGTTVSMTVTAGPGSKTDITTAGGITWSENDKLYVGFGGAYVGCLEITSGVGTPTGWFSGNVTLTGIQEGTTQTFHFFYLGSTERTLAVGATTVDVDFSSQEIYADANSKLANASKYHVGYGSAKGTVAGSEVTGINVTMVSKVALARFSFKKSGTPASSYTGELTLSGDHIYNSVTVGFGGSFSHGETAGNIILGAVSEGISERYVMLVPVGSGSETLNFGGGASGTKTLENGIEANKYYGRESAIEVTVTPKPKFSVSSTATVEFSPGNLYYDGSSWQFEDNQWDFRTYEGKASCINGVYNASSGTPTGHWGLFGWSGSTGSATYGKSTSTNSDDYSGSFKDWGDLAIGGYEVNTWRTLTCDEWNYLLGCKTSTEPVRTDDCRPDAKNLCEWKELDSNTHKGLVILPDGTENPSEVLGSITKTSDLATHGAVFLPAAGDRSGTGVSNVGSAGTYWSSKNKSTGNAYFMRFRSDNACTFWIAREQGYSVRLVRSVL